ncbi:MAG: choice-of-anchor D domain-containing protein [Armatimonadetes bacterium]|nr:choice-of-anchor D domain-containing protein [Armatimonadota bacterium]
MTRLRLLASLWLFALVAMIPIGSNAQTPTGKEYLVVLPPFIHYTEAQKNIASYSVEVMCSRKTKLNVRWGTTNYFPNGLEVNAGDRQVFKPNYPLPSLSAFMQPTNQLFNDSVNARVLVITSDQPITVQLRFDTLNRMETYGVMPVVAYDTLFTVSTYAGYSQYADRGGFTVVASQDNTVVTVVPRVDTWRIDLAGPNHPAGVPYTFTLNKYQAISFRTQSNQEGYLSDQTGSTIQSNKPIGVIGYGRTNTPSARPIAPEPPPPPAPPPMIPFPELTWYGKPIMEAQLSDNQAGSLFYSAPFARQDTSLVRIVATKNGTTIDTNGVRLKKPDGSADTILNRGAWVDLRMRQPMKIESSLPVIATQFGYSGGACKNDTIYSDANLPNPDTSDIPYGAPMMTQLLPVNRFARAVQWITPDPANRPSLPIVHPPGNHVWEHYALVTVPVGVKDSVLLDGNKIHPAIFNKPSSDGQYVSGILKLIPRQHVIEAEEPLSVIAYGFEWDDAYGHNAGEALRSRAKFGVDTLNIISCDNETDTAISVENLGNNAFLIDSIKATGFGIEVLKPNKMPFNYLPGLNNQVVLVVKTPTPGVYTGKLIIYTDANNKKVWEIPVTAIRDSAKLRVPGTTLDLGVLKSTESTRDTCVIVQNDGIRPLTISAVTFNGPGFQVIDPAQFPVAIQPGKADTICVRFTPSNDGLTERTMRIVGSPCLTPIDITIRAFKGAGASLSLSRSLEYSSYLCNAPAYVDSVIVLKSVGDEPVQIKTAGISGTHAGDYAITGASPAGQTIPPGGSLSFTVRFTPQGNGARVAQVDLTTTAVNAPTVAIDLRARKDTTTLTPSVASLPFPRVLACDDTVRLPVTFSNDGSVPDTITSIDFGTATAYGIDDQLPIIIYPGIPKTITVRFAPSTDGSFPATLAAVGAPCNLRATVGLTGERISPSLAASAPTVNFGTVYLCDGDTTAQVTITNDGQVADTINRAFFTGNPAFFMQENYPIVLEPGASRTFTMTFTPSAQGTFNGELNIEWGPCGRTTTVQVMGQGVQPSAQLSATGVDFGQVNIKTNGTGTIRLRNTGTVERTVKSLDLGGLGDVTITKPTQFPATIPPGGELEIEVEYAPQAKGKLAGTGTITVDGPCGQQLTFAIAGEAIGEDIVIAQLTVGAQNNVIGRVNQNVQIPLLITGSDNLTAAGISTMRIYLRYRYTLLAPLRALSQLPGMTATIADSRIVGNDRVMVIDLNGGTFPATGEIARLECLALLGDTLSTIITIDSATVTTPPNRQVTVNRQNGSFLTDGICRVDGDRFVLLDEGAALKALYPNPFSGSATIEFSLDQPGNIQLVVTDLRGVPVRTLVNSQLPVGGYSVFFDANNLPAGLYFCELHYGQTTLRQPLVLVK